MLCHMIKQCHVGSYQTVPCHAISNSAMPGHIKQCHARPYQMVPCRAQCHAGPYQTVPCHAISNGAMPGHIKWCHAVPYQTVPCRAISNGAMPCHIKWCHAGPYQTVPCQAVSYCLAVSFIILPCSGPCVAMLLACYSTPSSCHLGLPTLLAGPTIYMTTPGHEPIHMPCHTIQVGPSLTLGTPSSWAHVQLAIYYRQLSALVVRTVRYNSATLCAMSVMPNRACRRRFVSLRKRSLLLPAIPSSTCQANRHWISSLRREKTA